MITDAGFPGDTIGLSVYADIAALEQTLRNAPIAGVLTTGSTDLGVELRRFLAMRDGPILPLIDDAIGSNYLVRFFYEKTISVNTAAAGGNAALLSQGELD